MMNKAMQGGGMAELVARRPMETKVKGIESSNKKRGPECWFLEIQKL
jgi:hypothetical protein